MKTTPFDLDVHSSYAYIHVTAPCWSGNLSVTWVKWVSRPTWRNYQYLFPNCNHKITVSCTTFEWLKDIWIIIYKEKKRIIKHKLLTFCVNVFFLTRFSHIRPIPRLHNLFKSFDSWYSKICIPRRLQFKILVGNLQSDCRTYTA
jgi:hypothetical protein